MVTRVKFHLGDTQKSEHKNMHMGVDYMERLQEKITYLEGEWQRRKTDVTMKKT